MIVQKSEIHTGDLVIFCEIDSLLPDKPWFEFLKNGKGLRIKTMKMSGAISQGICFPLTLFENYGTLIKDIYDSVVGFKNGDTYVALSEGTDVTDVLGIVKWERHDASDEPYVPDRPPMKKYPKFLMRFKWFRNLIYKKGKHREAKGFPDFISKSDETRIQSATFYLDMGVKWLLSEKLDGCSSTFAMVRHKPKFRWQKAHYEYIVCSRNIRLWQKDNRCYWFVSDKYHIEDVLRKLIDKYDCDWIALQGECIAPNVQGNKYKVTEPDLYLFNFITSSDGRIGSLTGKMIMEEYGMKWVPIVASNVELPKTVDEMLALAHGQSAIGDTLREGLVCRTLDGKSSFKAVDPIFLMKYDE